MAREIEIKFAVDDFGPVRARLQTLGARNGHRVFEDNLVFDDAQGSLRARGLLLRLRRAERITLTVKVPQPDPRFKVREEIEVTLDDFDRARQLLETLGFRPVQRYQKVRETWRLGAVTVALDALPFGRFVELEGPPAALEQVVQALGFRLEQGLRQSYLDLYAALCRARGRPVGDIVFDHPPTDP
jgi:adenylate cyclase class 2